MQDVVKQHALCTIERIINPGSALGATLVPVLPPPVRTAAAKKLYSKQKPMLVCGAMGSSKV